MQCIFPLIQLCLVKKTPTERFHRNNLYRQGKQPHERLRCFNAQHFSRRSLVTSMYTHVSPDVSISSNSHLPVLLCTGHILSPPPFKYPPTLSKPSTTSPGAIAHSWCHASSSRVPQRTTRGRTETDANDAAT